MKPYYEHSGITIYHGDCAVIGPIIHGVECVVTDPPYGISWDTDYRHLSNWAESRQWPPVHGDDKPFNPFPWALYPRVVMWGANNYADRLPPGAWLVWDKRFSNGKGFMQEVLPLGMAR